MSLADVRRRLTVALAGRSEPLVAIGDRYVPAAALYTGARRRVRRPDLPVDDDLDRLEQAIADAWRSRLELPPVHLRGRRPTMLSAIAWPDSATCWADVAEPLLSGIVLLLRPAGEGIDEIADLLTRWRPERAHLTVEQVRALGTSDRGRAALAALRERDPQAARRAALAGTVA